MCRLYLQEAGLQESYDLHKFVQSVERLVLVNSFYWSTWAIMMMKDEAVCDDKAWQWAFIKGRTETFTRQRKEFNI
jgi:hypothetical protein